MNQNEEEINEKTNQQNKDAQIKHKDSDWEFDSPNGEKDNI